MYKWVGGGGVFHLRIYVSVLKKNKFVDILSLSNKSESNIFSVNFILLLKARKVNFVYLTHFRF